MQKGTPTHEEEAIYIAPGPMFEEGFRAYFAQGLRNYASILGLLPIRDIPKTNGFELIVDELGIMCHWIPMPIPGQSQTPWVKAYLAKCQSEIKDKCDPAQISKMADEALLEAICDYQPCDDYELDEEEESPSLPIIWGGRGAAA